MAKKKATSKKVKETQEKTPSGGFPPSVGTGCRHTPVSSEISQPGVARPQAAMLHETVPSEKTCLSETSRAPANPSGPLGHLPLAGEEFQKREGRRRCSERSSFKAR